MASYINRIESKYPEFTKAERRIADYILEKGNEVVYESSNETAAKAEVGEATLNRFCKKIGLGGFQELKILIAKYQVDFPITETPMGTMADKIEYNYQKTIEKTKDLLDSRQLEASIRLVQNAERIITIGSGSSGIAAIECENSLLRVGKTVKAIVDSHSAIMHVAMLGPKDLIIAFSLTGLTKEVISTLEYAKKREVPIIAITNFSARPVAQLADHVLLTSKKESWWEGGSLMAKISQLYLIDLLCTGFTTDNQRYVNRHREQVAKALIVKNQDS